jgi:hypothetical protein
MQGQWGDRLVFRPKSLALESWGLAIGSVFRSSRSAPGQCHLLLRLLRLSKGNSLVSERTGKRNQGSTYAGAGLI